MEFQSRAKNLAQQLRIESVRIRTVSNVVRPLVPSACVSRAGHRASAGNAATRAFSERWRRARIANSPPTGVCVVRASVRWRQANQANDESDRSAQPDIAQDRREIGTTSYEQYADERGNVPPLTLLRWSPHLNELLQLLKPVLNHHEAQRRGGRGSVRRFQHQEPSAIG